MSAASEPEDIPHLLRPLSDREAVMLEQCQRDALDAEAEARRVGRRAVRGLDPPGLAEQVAMIVEADAGGRMLLRMDRYQQFELQALLALAGGQQAAGAAEEGVVRDIEREWQA